MIKYSHLTWLLIRFVGPSRKTRTKLPSCAISPLPVWLFNLNQPHKFQDICKYSHQNSRFSSRFHVTNVAVILKVETFLLYSLLRYSHQYVSTRNYKVVLIWLWNLFNKTRYNWYCRNLWFFTLLESKLFYPLIIWIISSERFWTIFDEIFLVRIQNGLTSDSSPFSS